MALLAGIDGCKDGWICVALDTVSGSLSGSVLATGEIPRQRWDLAGIDIPIGIPDHGRRDADREARALLGWPRCSSVFPCPIRPALAARSWEEACAITQAADGRRVQRQTFAILPKIREIDELMRGDPALREHLYEVHPEVSFASWKEQPMIFRKKAREGREERQALIRSHFGQAFTAVARQLAGHWFGADDLADAFAALWTTQRLYDRRAVSLPAEPQHDSCGLPMHIWY